MPRHRFVLIVVVIATEYLEKKVINNKKKYHKLSVVVIMISHWHVRVIHCRYTSSGGKTMIEYLVSEKGNK